jgi:hypothetical protein
MTHKTSFRAASLVLLGLAVLMLVPFLYPTVHRIHAGLKYPYQMDSEEGFVLWQAWQLRQGRNIFRPLDTPPYVAATYGPVYPLLGAATLGRAKPSFFGGRLIAALSVAAICAILFWIVGMRTRHWLAALLGPLLFLNTYDVYQWLPFYRVDFTALALGAAGLGLLAPERNYRLPTCTTSGDAALGGLPSCAVFPWRFRLACACFVAMVYTKQVEVAPFAAAVIYFLIHDRRVAWRLFRNVAGWGIAIAAVLALVTRGQFLIHNIYYNANPFDVSQLGWLIVHFFRLHRVFLCVVVVCLAWYLGARLRKSALAHGRASALPEDAVARPEGRADLDLFAIYAVVASVGLLGLGKIGAATNYIIEPKLAMSLFVALALGHLFCSLGPCGRRGSGTQAVAVGKKDNGHEGLGYHGDGGEGTGAIPGRSGLGARAVFVIAALLLLLHGFEFLFSSTLHFGRWIQRIDRSKGGPVVWMLKTEAVARYLSSRVPVLEAGANLNPTPYDYINGARLVAMLRQAPEPVFCEHAIYPMLAGREVYIQPFIMSQLAREGKWDPAPVVRALREGRFSVLATTEDVLGHGFTFHYADEMRSAIRESYRLTETLGSPDARRPILFTHYILEPIKERAGNP